MQLINIYREKPAKTLMTRSPRELAAQKVQLQRDQERLFQDLLGILDALDHACSHWQKAEQDHAQALDPSSTTPEYAFTPEYSFWRQLQQWGRWVWRQFGGRSDASPSTTAAAPAATTDSMAEVLTSAREGVELIQRSLLEILRQRQVVPLDAVGKPFDPEQMYALGRQETEAAPENTVLQEVVRGYRWQNRILREAQVLVAVKPAAAEDKPV